MTGPGSSEPFDFKRGFQNLRKIALDIEEDKGRGGLLNQLFQNQSWYLANFKLNLFEAKSGTQVPQPADPSMEVSEENMEQLENSANPELVQLENIAPTEMDQTLSAIEVFAQLRKGESTPPPAHVTHDVEGIQVTHVGETEVFLGRDVENSTPDEILFYSVNEGKFSRQPLTSADADIDILLIGSPEKESNVKAQQDLNSETWQLLGKMAKALGLEYKRIYFSLGLEFDPSSSTLDLNRFAQQMKILKPKLILSLGATASNLMLGYKDRLSVIHGKIFTRDFLFEGSETLKIKFMPIYHPEFLLINPNMKRSTWEDMKASLQYLASSKN